MCSRWATFSSRALVVAVLLGGAVAVARAAPEPTPQQREEAWRLNKEARADLEAGRYDAAIAKLRRALAFSQDPTTIYNLALTYDTAGDWVLAGDHYRLCLSKTPDPETRRLAEEKLAALEPKLVKGRLVVERKERWVDVPGAGEAKVRLELLPLDRLGSLLIEATPTGAAVWLDDEPLGTAPIRPQRVLAGTHRVRVEMAGYETETEVVKVVPGAATTVALRLEQSRSGPDYSPWTWVTLGSGLALVAGGGLAYGLGEADHEEVVGTSGYGQAAGGVVADRSYDSARDLVESGDEKKIAGYVLWGVGGAALVASTVLFVLEEVGDGGEAAVTVTGTGTDGGGFVSLSGRF